MENTTSQITTPQKRNTAFKQRIGAILSGKQNIENEKLKNVEINGKNVVRVNIIANITDKYIQEGEKKFGSITVDDGTGQIKVKSFGDDVDSFFSQLNQGDTIMIIGLIRYWNNEIYITPEVIKKKAPEFLLIRKMEVESDEKSAPTEEQTKGLKDKILAMVKEAEKDGGIDVEKLILDLHEKPDTINKEIKKLLEDGIAYEPRPGKIRYLG
ncbi:MAG: OB-fold nucleic acid binding domain-containing protein [archaeon]